MKTRTRSAVAGMAVLMTTLLAPASLVATPTAHAQFAQCTGDVYARVYFDKVTNKGRGNMEAVVNLNGQRLAAGTPIQLTQNGQYIVDSTPNINDTGLVFWRLGNGRFYTIAFGQQRPQDFEIAYGRIVLDNGTYTGITNDPAHAYEDARDGKHFIRNTNPPAGQHYGHNDEFNAPIGGQMLSFFSGHSTDSDGFTASFIPTSNCQGSSSSSSARAQCSDGFDNDGDNRVDSSDPGCHYDGNANNQGSYNPNDNDEYNQQNQQPQCSDGSDNDGDNLTDGNDPGCHYDGNPNNQGSYNPNDNDEYNQQQQTGCIDVTKLTYNANGSQITPVAQFTFRLENGQTALNDSTGHARFFNIPAGSHTVSEIVPQGWQLVSQNNVYVNVLPGSQCAQVTFQNRQLYIGGSSSYSSSSCYDYYSCQNNNGYNGWNNYNNGYNSYNGYNNYNPYQQQGWGWNSGWNMNNSSYYPGY